uniref:Uncharacterized protein n=1 Tax=Cacopsylla melanoneura TaxID=428564 RepID=A0A8D8R788_9HEMI
MCTNVYVHALTLYFSVLVSLVQNVYYVPTPRCSYSYYLAHNDHFVHCMCWQMWWLFWEFLLLHFKSEFLIKLHVSNHMFLIILRRRRGVESGFGFMVSFFLLFLVLMFLALLV